MSDKLKEQLTNEKEKDLLTTEKALVEAIVKLYLRMNSGTSRMSEDDKSRKITEINELADSKMMDELFLTLKINKYDFEDLIKSGKINLDKNKKFTIKKKIFDGNIKKGNY